MRSLCYHLREKKLITGYPVSLHSYDYSFADSLRDHLGDVPWEDIFKLGASASKFFEWFQVGIDVYIPHRK